MGLGKLTASREHLEQALKLLGRPVPAAKRVGRELLGQAFTQTSHRLRSPKILAADDSKHDEILEAARVHDLLVRLYYYSQERSFLLHSSLQAMNLAERVGAVPEMARMYSLMCVAAGLVSRHSLARLYERLALKTADNADDVLTRGRVLARIGLYNLGVGSWQRASDLLDESAAIAERFNDHRQWGESAGLRAYVAYHRGEFADGLRRFAQVGTRATAQGNVQYQGWGLWGRAHNLIRLGRLDEAVTALTEVLERLAHMDDRGAEVVSHGLLAIARAYREEWQLAQASADNVLRLATSAHARFSLADMEGLAGAAEVYLMLWERQGGGQAEAAEAYAGSAREACEAMFRYARIYTFGRPRAELLQGAYHRLAGNERRANQAFRSSLRAAQTLEMPYEQGRAHYEIGRHLNAGDPSRRDHLQASLEIFSRLQASLDEARVRAQLTP
jgi:hypothetical protein